MRIIPMHMDKLLPLIFGVVILYQACSRNDVNSNCCTDIRLSNIVQITDSESDSGRYDVMQSDDGSAIIVSMPQQEGNRIIFAQSTDGGESWFRNLDYETRAGISAEQYKSLEHYLLEPQPNNFRVRYRWIRQNGALQYQRSDDGGFRWKNISSKFNNWIVYWGTHHWFNPQNAFVIYSLYRWPGKPGRYGMYKSQDGGETFELMYESWIGGCISISRSDPRIMYGSAAFGSIVKSTNGGEAWNLVGQNDHIRTSWQSQNDGTNNKNFHKTTEVMDIDVDPTNPDCVYAVTWDKGILRSNDGGQTWCYLNTGIKTVHGISNMEIVLKQPDTIIAGTNQGIIRSIDRGCHWQKIDIAARLLK